MISTIFGPCVGQRKYRAGMVAAALESDWSEYDQWNAALANQFFSAETADLPAYVDVDDDILTAAAAEVGVHVDDVRKALATAVRPTLGLESGAPLARHAQRFRAWRRDIAEAKADQTKRASAEVEPPPVVALLTTCVLAAERMGADMNLPAHAYYPRLGEVFGLSASEREALKRGFPVTEGFWRGVNEYLETCEGQRGLPTAYSIGQRYVGIPQSQAMVRATDRSRLPNFFGEFGLVPGSELVPADLERLLDIWIGRNPSPVSNQLRTLWSGGKARERVSGVVAVELSLWDGVFRKGAEVGETSRGSLELTALRRQGFGAQGIEFSFAARLPRAAEVDELVVESAEGKPHIGVAAAAGARLRPIPGSRLDGESLVGTVVELADPNSGQSVVRRPRRVVPLRRDELLGVLVEVDRIQLADNTTLLIKDDPNLLQQAMGVIEHFGRRGTMYRAGGSGDFQSLSGLPDGWVLVDDVQIFAVPQDVKRLDLHPLVPLTTAQLNFAGGLKLPGRVRKWSSLRPPEIHAAVSEAETITVSIFELGGDERVLFDEWTEPSSAVVISVEQLELADGDYEVELAAENRVISQSTLRLRSAATPDVFSWETCTQLNYYLDEPFGKALTASAHADRSTMWVDGVSTVGSRSHEWAAVPVRDGVGWDAKSGGAERDRPVVVLGSADPNSCVVTGAHRIELPTWMGGRPKDAYIVGVCSECGLRKTMPSRPRWKSSENRPTRHLPDKIEFISLGSRRESGVDLDTCLDALVHVGGGTMSSLERIASQAEGGALFFDNFVRTLETSGQIDVRREPSSLQTAEWEANPAFLGETISNGFLLAGVWSRDTRNLLGKTAEAMGGELTKVADESGLSAWFARGLDANALEVAVSKAGIVADVIVDGSRSMLNALPPLSEVEDSLPRVPIPQYSKATIFDVAQARWVSTPGVAVPGAYRVEQNFRTTSIWVDAAGAVDRTCRIGTVQLVKHFAALHAKRPLLGYLASQSKLLVPMGAELPGLFGRAAVLCSGISPSISPKIRTVAYHDVPRDIADQMNTLLAS